MSQPAETTERGSGAHLLERLSARHLDLMARLPRDEATLAPSEAFIAEVRAFAAEVQAAGAVTSRRKDRDTLRNMLLFWAMELAKRDGAVAGAALPALADFQGAKTETTRDEKADPAARPRASGTAVSGDSLHSGHVGPMATAEGMASPVASRAAATLSTLQTAGRQISDLVKGIAAAAGGRAVPAAAHPADASASKVGEATLDASRQAIRFAALARAWKDARPEVKTGLLLSDGAIAEASAYVNDDPDIKAFVEASRDWQEQRDGFRRRARYVLFGLTGALVVFVGAVIYATYINWHIEGLNKKLRAANGAFEEANTQLQSLNESLKVSEQDRRRTSVDARRAVDALSNGRIEPLKALLQRIARAEPSELEPLHVQRVTRATSGTAESNNVAATQQRAPPSDAVQSVVRQAPACSGALWLGSAAEGGSRLQNIADPSTVRVNDRVVTRQQSDIRLRAALPAPDYEMPPQIGLVPGGSTVTVAGPPVPYERRGIDQYWAKVTVPRQFCTSVFIQYFGPADSASLVEVSLKNVEAALKNIGVQVPQSEAVETARGRAEVRYFWEEDAAVASAVARQLAPFNGGRTLNLRALTSFPNRPVSGRVEVWINLP
jgi:hypothetical protein